MIELDLLGVGADGQTLVFTDSEGERYCVAITDELRGSVRRDRPVLESVPAPGAAPLRPKDIQALLRAGATPQEIAQDHGLEVQQVLRYEGPVRAEQSYALSRALSSHVGNDPDSPIMGDLVVDRLAARGVDSSSLTWTARREAQGPWQVCLTFVQGAAELAAHWTLSSAGVVEAVDQEARWLTETVSQTPSASVFTPLSPLSEPGETADEADVKAREHLIDQLNAARGKRQPLDVDLDDADDEDVAEFLAAEAAASPSGSKGSSISARIYSLAAGRTDVDTSSASATAPVPPLAEGDAADEESVLPGMDSLQARPNFDRAKKKSGRRSVPSWDEIVFGSRS